MTTQDKQEWQELCDYIYREILKYEKPKLFPKTLILRLKGLSQGKEYANGKAEQMFSFKFILCLFKYIKGDLLRIIDKTQIKDEKHLCNLIMKVAQDNINDFSDKVKQNEKAKDKNIDTKEVFVSAGSQYKKRSAGVKNNW